MFSLLAKQQFNSTKGRFATQIQPLFYFSTTFSTQSDYKPLPLAEKKRLLTQYKNKVFDGNLLARRIRQSLQRRIITRRDITKSETLIRPVLGHIIVGDLPQQEKYVKLKLMACDEVGIGHTGFKLPATASEQDLMEKVRELQDNP